METSSRGLNCIAFNLPVPVQTRSGRGAGLRCKHQLPLQNRTGKGDPPTSGGGGLNDFSVSLSFSDCKTDSLRKSFKNIYLELSKKYFKGFCQGRKVCFTAAESDRMARKTPGTPEGPSPPCSLEASFYPGAGKLPGAPPHFTWAPKDRV